MTPPVPPVVAVPAVTQTTNPAANPIDVTPAPVEATTEAAGIPAPAIATPTAPPIEEEEKAVEEEEEAADFFPAPDSAGWEREDFYSLARNRTDHLTDDEMAGCSDRETEFSAVGKKDVGALTQFFNEAQQDEVGTLVGLIYLAADGNVGVWHSLAMPPEKPPASLVGFEKPGTTNGTTKVVTIPLAECKTVAIPLPTRAIAKQGGTHFAPPPDAAVCVVPKVWPVTGTILSTFLRSRPLTPARWYGQLNGNKTFPQGTTGPTTHWLMGAASIRRPANDPFRATATAMEDTERSGTIGRALMARFYGGTNPDGHQRADDDSVAWDKFHPSPTTTNNHHAPLSPGQPADHTVMEATRVRIQSNSPARNLDSLTRTLFDRGENPTTNNPATTAPAATANTAPEQPANTAHGNFATTALDSYANMATAATANTALGGIANTALGTFANTARGGSQQAPPGQPTHAATTLATATPAAHPAWGASANTARGGSQQAPPGQPTHAATMLATTHMANAPPTTLATTVHPAVTAALALPPHANLPTPPNMWGTFPAQTATPLGQPQPWMYAVLQKVPGMPLTTQDWAFLHRIQQQAQQHTATPTTNALPPSTASTTTTAKTLDIDSSTRLLTLAGLTAHQANLFPPILLDIYQRKDARARDTTTRKWWTQLTASHPQLPNKPPADVTKGLKEWDFAPDTGAARANGWHTSMFVDLTDQSVHQDLQARRYITEASNVTPSD